MTLGSFKGLGYLGNPGTSTTSVFDLFEKTISLTLSVLTVSAGLWFIFQIFGGALGWLASGGEKQALQNAQKRIVNAIVGLLVVVMSYSFIALIATIFGLNILSPYAALLGVPAPGVGSGSSTPPCADHHGVDCP